MAIRENNHDADALTPRETSSGSGTAPGMLQGWLHAPTAIVERSDAQLPIALSDLRDEEQLSSLVRLVGTRERSTARAGAAIFRHAIASYVSVILTPFAFDCVTVAIEPDHFGFDLGGDGDVRSVWVSPRDASYEPARAAHEHAKRAARLLLPVATALRVTARIGDRGSDLAIVDRLNGVARQLARSARCTAEPGWVEEFVDGLGIGNPRSIRTIEVQPDDGPSIELPVARVCCIGARRATVDVCPTCPAVSNDVERQQRAREWLDSLDDQSFLRVVGRQRI